MANTLNPEDSEAGIGRSALPLLSKVSPIKERRLPVCVPAALDPRESIPRIIYAEEKGRSQIAFLSPEKLGPLLHESTERGVGG